MIFGKLSTHRHRHAAAALVVCWVTGCGTDEQPRQTPTLEMVGPQSITNVPSTDLLVPTQQVKHYANDGDAGDSFGRGLAVFGDTAILGAHQDEGISAGSAGSAYVFVKADGSWMQQAKLLAADGAFGDGFGYSVAISGDTAIIGAFANKTPMANASTGAAYVFVRSNGVWNQQAKLIANDAAQGDNFGWSVAISGNTALVGAIYAKDNGVDKGAVYVFVRNGVSWSQQQKLVPADGISAGLFGWSVGLENDSALIGAPKDDDKGPQAGAAYSFLRNGSTWSMQQKLVANDGATGDLFGTTVALSGDTGLFGACYDDDNGMDSGSAYVFDRNGGTLFTQKQKLLAGNGQAGDAFGLAISLSGDVALVAAPQNDELGVGAGSVYSFARTGGTFAPQSKILPTDGAAGDVFGVAVAVQNNEAFIGAFYDDDKGANAGAAYTFLLLGSNGDSCMTAAECASGFCVDGVCCNASCGDGAADDCVACSVSAGAAMNGTCGPRPMGTVCRAGAGTCDVEETCDGVASACPADGKSNKGFECRPSAAECDAAEACDGMTNDCPMDIAVADGTACNGGACLEGMCMNQGGAGGSGGAAGNGGAGGGGGAAGNGGAGGLSGEGGHGGGTNQVPTADGSCDCRTTTSSPGTSSPGLWFFIAGALLSRSRRKRIDTRSHP